MSLVMIIPSRGRPRMALAAAELASRHRDSLDTRTVIAVDGDPDPAYRFEGSPAAHVWVERDGEHRGMVAALNLAAMKAVRFRSITHVGFMGDDHRVRTPGWDTELMRSAGPVGVAYGDDLNPSVALPTSVVLGADIVRALGYMAPPALGHLYVDDFWQELGRRLGRLAYRPDVVIEHMHPTLDKEEWDEQYRRTNAPEQFERDAAAWKAYRDGGEMSMAIYKIKRKFPELFSSGSNRRRPRARRPS